MSALPVAGPFPRPRPEERGSAIPPREPIATHDPARDVLQRLADGSRGFARFDVEDCVGEGGMGIVLRVHDPDLNRTLALKRMKPPRVGAELPHESARRVARFLDEAQVTGQLDHPGIIPVHELGLDPSGQPYFTMKLVRGKTLKDILPLARENLEGWNATRALGVLLRMCEAMSYAHAHGVVHRDLKPANVMIGRFGEVYVMDWGLARVFGAEDQTEFHDLRHSGSPDGSPLITEDGEVFGTPAYMSPEQATGHPDAVGPQSDVYAIGAILYELLAGNAPFTYQRSPTNNRQVLERLRNGPPPALEDVARHAPAELVAICRRAMERDPDRRYATMEELANDVRAYLELRVVRAYRTGPIVELRKWVSRNRSPAVLGIALLVTIVAAGVGFGIVESARARDLALRGDSLETVRLVDEARTSWPVHPRSSPAIRTWLASAERLADTHASSGAVLTATRDEFVESGRGRVVLAEVDRKLADEAVAARKRADAWSAYLEELRSKPIAADATALEVEWAQSAREVLPAEIAYWKGRADELERRSLPLARLDSSDLRDQQRFDQLQRLAHGVEELRDRAIPAVRAALKQCELAGSTVADAAWGSACAEIADPARTPAYRGLALEPQVGLVPLRRDEHSGLYEFWHVASGKRPRPDEHGGWEVDADTGVVLVLLPGGSATAGAQAADPGAARYDPDARKTEALRSAALDPYFVSKYELTQGQWRRMTGRMDGAFVAGMSLFKDPRVSAAHPVEKVDWWTARAALRRHGLDLPTELQWEHAARAGSDLRYLLAADASTLGVLANGGDDRWALIAARPGPGYDDGYALPARVGSFAPNAFGLHDVVGNVAEWCRDAYADSCETTPPRPGDGEIEPLERFARTFRGGSYRSDAFHLRVSRREQHSPDEADDDVGMRPVRALDYDELPIPEALPR